MNRLEKIELVLSARPRLTYIIKAASDEQLDQLVEEAMKDLDKELEEAAFN